MKKLLFTLLILFGAISQVSAVKTVKIQFATEANNWLSKTFCAIWAWGPETSAEWYTLTDDNSDGIYEASVPDGVKTWILNCSDENEKWGTQTGNITCYSGYIYTINRNDAHNIGDGITIAIETPKSFKLQFANAAANMTGKTDLFSMAMFKNQLLNIDKEIDSMLNQAPPPGLAEFLGMSGFKVNIDLHGNITHVNMPAVPDESGD